MNLPKRQFSAMSRAEIAAGDPSGWIAVLPLGATEQHGPHLPAQTDTIIATGVAERLAATIPQELPATFLAAEAVGYSPEHLGFPGTRSLAYGEATERWIGIGANNHDAPPAVAALFRLRETQWGGPAWSVADAEAVLRETGFVDVRTVPPTPGALAIFVVGRRG